MRAKIIRRAHQLRKVCNINSQLLHTLEIRIIGMRKSFCTLTDMYRNGKIGHTSIIVLAFLLGLNLGLWLSRNARIVRHILRCHHMIHVVGREREQNLEQELGSTAFLLVAVLIKTQDLERNEGILYNDFSETNIKFIFFTTKRTKESFLHKTPVVCLEDTDTSSETLQVLHLRMLSHVDQYHHTKFNWFMFTDSSFFVNINKLTFLRNLNYSNEFLLLPEERRDSSVDKNGYDGLQQGTSGTKGSIGDVQPQGNTRNAEDLKAGIISESVGRNTSRMDTRRPNRTVDNFTSHSDTKGYQISHMDMVHLFQPGIIMSRSLLHKLSTLTGPCFSNQDAVGKCFEERVSSISWLNDYRGQHWGKRQLLINSVTCRAENKDLVSKTVTADLSHDLNYCMYRLRVQLLSKRIRALNKNSKTLQVKLRKLKGFISTTVYEKLEQIRNAFNDGVQQKEPECGHLFTMSKNYLINSKVSWSLHNNEHKGVRMTIGTVMDTIRNAHQDNIHFHTLYYGYMLNQPIKGLQYALNIFTNKEHHIAWARRDFGALQSRLIEEKTSRTVKIVVPLAGRLKNFKQFMINLEENILKKQEPISILVVYFPQSNSPTEHMEIFNGYNTTYNGSTFNWLNLPGGFARARALQAAVEFYKDNNLLFFADVDLSFNTEFLQRCRDNTVARQQVYFPVMFKLFNPKINGFALNSSEHFRSFERNIGDWALHSFGPVCAYRDDVMSIGGFNVKIKEWGYEDIQLFKSFLSRNYDVIRVADPGLLHLYHAHAKCDVIRNNIQRLMCTGAMLNGLASKDSIVNYLLRKNYLENI